ncbi:MAG: PIN domain-containing protein [Myxococcota bacterium]
MRSPLLLDTGGWLKALAGDRPWADAVEEAGELIVPGLVLAEVDYHLRHQRRAMHRLLQDLESGAYRYEPPTASDLARARELDARFKKLDLGLVDASVAALAERLGVFRVLTTDSDFVALRVGPGYRLAFELACPLA